MGFIFDHKWDANLRVSTITLEVPMFSIPGGCYLTVSSRSRIPWLSSAKWAKPCWVVPTFIDWMSWRCRFSRQPKYHQCCCWINPAFCWWVPFSKFQCVSHALAADHFKVYPHFEAKNIFFPDDTESFGWLNQVKSQFLLVQPTCLRVKSTVSRIYCPCFLDFNLSCRKPLPRTEQ